MSYYIGIDVACKESVISGVDADGKEGVRGTCPTSVVAIDKLLKRRKIEVKAIAIETGTECHHLANGLEDLGYCVKIVDARKASKIISGFHQNKNDPNDAHGLAQMLRAELYSSVRAKQGQQLDWLALSAARRQAIDMRVGLANSIRAQAKGRGVKCSKAFSVERWRSIIRENENISDCLEETLTVLLDLLEVTETQIKKLDHQLAMILKQNKTAKRLQTVPGVGPVLAFTFIAHISEEQVFARRRDVGAFVGMTPKEYSSGQKVRRGKVSKCGPPELRRLLMQAGMTIQVNVKTDYSIRKWANRLAIRKGRRLAAIALGRKLAVIMYSMMHSEEDFTDNHQQQKLAQVA